jgi:CO/xanthine dehydrogenase Mo-binding subunit
MSEYLVPTFLDAPAWNVEVLEVPCETGPFGAKGIGELPANGGAPAFLSAVENATGVFAPYIPLTGEKLWMELEKLRGANYETPKDGEPR